MGYTSQAPPIGDLPLLAGPRVRCITFPPAPISTFQAGPPVGDLPLLAAPRVRRHPRDWGMPYKTLTPGSPIKPSHGPHKHAGEARKHDGEARKGKPGIGKAPPRNSPTTSSLRATTAAELPHATPLTLPLRDCCCRRRRTALSAAQLPHGPPVSRCRRGRRTHAGLPHGSGQSAPSRPPDGRTPGCPTVQVNPRPQSAAPPGGRTGDQSAPASELRTVGALLARGKSAPAPALPLCARCRHGRRTHARLTRARVSPGRAPFDLVPTFAPAAVSRIRCQALTHSQTHAHGRS
ncbi:hypothetical protein SORBI_3001G376332 [Sorghum bicolor]|uniref:Uncharacterized protein n=1 Tax=Sorghum bicolor TaxID=4558 RepID=A0A1Z5S9W9_SORBI|nr:hypothetical protein SORBI_3001G376332 [Sorghum bicolor]